MISRKAVLDTLEDADKFMDEDRTLENYKALLKECYEVLPSVTTKQKMGRWIRMKAYEKWGCSECHTVFKFTFKEHNFCPNFGCRMVEPQESEDKE